MDNEQKPYKRYKSSRFRGRSTLDKELGRKRGKGKPSSQDAGAGGGVPQQSVQPQPQVPVVEADQWRERGSFPWGKVLLYGLLFTLLAVAVFGGISFWRVDRAVRASNDRVPADAMAQLESSSGLSASPVNILFIGSDQRPGESARADTLLLMRVDHRDKVISQLSIPRDTLADIPGYGEGKINSAYSYGGPALQIQAVEELTGLPVHHYVEIDFNGFPAIVDSLGGVDIDVPAPIDSLYPEGVEWTEVHFDEGPQHMDGEEALVYVRVRYSDNDFQRMARQQQFMEALQKSMSSPVNLARLPLTSPGMIDNLTTDLSTTELMRLAWVKYRTSPENNRKFVLAGYGQDIGGVSYVVLDEVESQAMIQEFLAGG